MSGGGLSGLRRTEFPSLFTSRILAVLLRNAFAIQVGSEERAYEGVIGLLQCAILLVATGRFPIIIALRPEQIR